MYKMCLKLATLFVQSSMSKHSSLCYLGLIAIAQSVGVTLLPPRKKINVMLMGNHSAGKSSFINW